MLYVLTDARKNGCFTKKLFKFYSSWAWNGQIIYREKNYGLQTVRVSYVSFT